EGGELILISAEGKELKILEGEPVIITIQDKDLVLVREGNALELVKEGVIGLVAKKDVEGSLTFSVVPRVKVQKVGTSAAKRVALVVPSGKGEKPTYIWITGDQTAEIKKKLRELQEKLDQTKEPDVDELRKAIRELVAELPKQEARDRVAIKVGESPEGFYVVQGKEGAGQAWILQKSDKNTITMNSVTVKSGGKTGFSVAYRIGQGETSKAVYERIVERVRQELPEGCTLDPEFDEKSGAITLNFTGTGTEGVSAEFIKKLVDIIKGEVKQR
ncbi:MAG: hypothetical protein ABIG68_07705, partial [Acidobacteriota bacterium]